jgi:hypothetical protein
MEYPQRVNGKEQVLLISDSQSPETALVNPTRGQTNPMESSTPSWNWASVGFDVTRKHWFIHLFNQGAVVKTFNARNLILIHGCGIQYQWINTGPNVSWHVRERLFAADVKSIRYEESGDLVLESARKEASDPSIPEDYSYLCYAFSLNTSRGFVEFYDERDALLHRIAEKWLVTEDLTRRTVGSYPGVRFRVERKDIKNIFVSKTTVILIG